MENDTIITQDVFLYDMVGEDANGRSSAATAPPASDGRASGSAITRGEAAGCCAGRRRSQGRGLSHEPANACTGFSRRYRHRRRWHGVIYPMLSGEKHAEARRASIAKPEPAARSADAKNQRTRREQVEGSLKELEARRAKESKISLAARLTQAGLDWSPQKFMVISAILAVIGFAVAMTPTLIRSGTSATAPVIVDAESSSRSFDLGIGSSLVFDMLLDIRGVSPTSGTNSTAPSESNLHHGVGRRANHGRGFGARGEDGNLRRLRHH